MTTLADTIKTALDAGWAEGTEPTYINTGDNVGPVVTIAEYIQFIEYNQNEIYTRFTVGRDRKTQTIDIEVSTRTSEDRLDTLVAEVRTLTNALQPATYNSVTISAADKSFTSKVLKKYTARIRVTVITLGVART